MSWPQTGCAPPPTGRTTRRGRIAGPAGLLLVVAGAAAIGVAVAVQVYAPQPSPGAAGALGPGAAQVPPLRRSLPVSVDIPAIGVHARLLRLGVTARGAMRVPSLARQAGEAAWYQNSVTPGQRGTSVIEGHVDTYRGPAVFFRLGALHPGDTVDVRLADGVVAVFHVTGVRQYAKSHFPARTIYRTTRYAALRLITCGGAFDAATRNYLSSVVVFASLTSGWPPGT
jgi:hypothetical protein